MTERAIAKEIVDAAFRMRTTLGPGLLESIYQTVLAYEPGRRCLHTVNRQPSTASKTITQSPQAAKRRGNTSSASPWNFKGHPWLFLARRRMRPGALHRRAAETQRKRLRRPFQIAEPRDFLCVVSASQLLCGKVKLDSFATAPI